MEERYRYYYDAGGRPVVTVCEIEDEGVMSRGVAICSPRDQPCKKTGRKIARDRAWYAMKYAMEDNHRRPFTNLPVFRDEALSVMESVGREDLMLKVELEE